MQQQDISRLLRWNQWLADDDHSEEGFIQALRGYQALHGLKIDAIAGPVTKAEMTAPRCGLPDILPNRQGNLCKWPHKKITYALNLSLPTLDKNQIEQAFKEAFALWSAVCDLEFQLVGVSNRPNILIQSGSIDGPSNTLAWSQLPCNVTANSQLQQKYDTSESYVISVFPARNYIDLVRVAAHEIGHALGLEHGPAGALLAPTYSTRIRSPQVWDIEQVVKRYGEPANNPAPTPTPEPGPDPTDPTKPPGKYRYVIYSDTPISITHYN